jgi:hypothetical protein
MGSSKNTVRRDPGLAPSRSAEDRPVRRLVGTADSVGGRAQAAGIGFAKEGNCFTRIGDPERLAQVADTLSQPGTIGRLSQVIDRWIYTACRLCCGLDLDEQARSGFGYAYSIYQLEYSRNLIFESGAVMEKAFDTSWTGPRPGWTCPGCAPCSGSPDDPAAAANDLSPLQAAVIDRPQVETSLRPAADPVPRSAPPASAASTSTPRRALAAVLSPWPWHPTGSPPPTSPRRCDPLPARPRRTTPSGKPPMIAYDLRKLRGKQLVLKPSRTRRYHARSGSTHHRGATHPARSGDRPDPRRRPPTRTGTPTHDPHTNRPGLRDPLHTAMRTLFHDPATDTAA